MATGWGAYFFGLYPPVFEGNLITKQSFLPGFGGTPPPPGPPGRPPKCQPTAMYEIQRAQIPEMDKKITRN
jgi:hypothetical protein